jgi:mevalonate kinase
MGEHAVVYGRPALAAAIDLRLTVHLSPLAASAPPGAVRLDLPGLPHAEATTWDAVRAHTRAAREGWEAYAREPSPERFHAVRGGAGDEPAHLVKVALGEAAAALGDESPPGLSLRVVSALPVGSGFGSSAATATGVVAAYLLFRGTQGRQGRDPRSGLSARGEQGERIARIVQEAERRQHGLPSGIDGATVLHGGLLWARRLESGSLEIERVTLRSPLLARFRVYDTGTPSESTGAVVAAVRHRRDHAPERHERLLHRIEAATRGFRDELEREEGDPARLQELIRDAEACLEELGVVPPEVAALARRIEAAGGAAKISGAGALSGPGAGSLLVYHPDPEWISGWSFLQPFPFHPVQLGAEGLRLETDA